MTEKEIHEGEIEHNVACWDPNDREYLSSTPIKEPDLNKYNLKEGDKIQYSIDEQGYVVVIGKIEITKKIEPVIQ